MNFSGKKVLRTFTSTASQNAWAFLEGIGWRKVLKDQPDGVSNVFMMLNVALTNNRTVSGTTDSNNRITVLYLN